MGFPSGQREQTVNLSSLDYGGSNPPPTTRMETRPGHVGQEEKRIDTGYAGIAQLVERQPSKLNVASSNLVSRSREGVCRSSGSEYTTSRECRLNG